MTTWGASLADEAFAVLLIGDQSDDVSAALDLTGGRVRERIAWDAVENALGPQTGQPVLMIEAIGVDDRMLVETLPQLASAIKLLELRAVVALTAAQIDRVTAVLLCARVQLLCDSSVADRVVALTIAAQLSQPATLHDRVSEGEGARLAQLNAEVARIAEVLARLSRREDRALQRGDVADRSQNYEPPPELAPDEEPVDAAAIRQAIRARRLRAKFLGEALFEDPAWDILLDLYAAHLERAQVSVSSLCIAAAVAPTTALRWIGKMGDAGLLERQPDPFDRRRAFMALTPRALAGMREYMAAVRTHGLSIV